MSVKVDLPEREDRGLQCTENSGIFPIGQIHRFMGQSWAGPRREGLLASEVIEKNGGRDRD
ncbi:hypothetical protein [Brevundimonas sp.]|uniref:hypothetical protein n=1 Tax=Brevundimonas sp. TaxID=1871086 RepID=UPI001DC5E00A|nr:hypothetical protein [Brevundimonas sp.]MBL0946850.1 hypothetical protein [Brevundimonas sp.]